jgi:hypothetical protein
MRPINLAFELFTGFAEVTEPSLQNVFVVNEFLCGSFKRLVNVLRVLGRFSGFGCSTQNLLKLLTYF